jgi:hypothetical protein
MLIVQGCMYVRRSHLTSEKMPTTQVGQTGLYSHQHQQGLRVYTHARPQKAPGIGGYRIPIPMRYRGS